MNESIPTSQPTRVVNIPRSSRTEMERHILSKQGPLGAYYDAYMKGEVKIVDFFYMVLKSANAATSVQMFTANDQAVVSSATPGSSIRAGMLEDGNCALLYEMGIIGVAGAGTTDGTTQDYVVLPALARSGKINFTINGQLALPAEQSMEMFNTANTANSERSHSGCIVLDNPIVIPPLQPMRMQLDFPTALAANFFLKLLLRGSMIYSK